MKKLSDIFKFGNDGRIDLRDNSLYNKYSPFNAETQDDSSTRNSSEIYWLSNENTSKSFLIKYDDDKSHSTDAEILFQKVLEHLKLPNVEIAKGSFYLPSKKERNIFKHRKSIRQYAKCTIQPNFLKKGDKFISAYNFIENTKQQFSTNMSNYSNYLSLIESLKLQSTNFKIDREIYDQITKMMLVDYCFGQIDRSTNNFGFIINKNNQLKLAPIFDNGLMNICNMPKQTFKVAKEIYKNNTNRILTDFNPMFPIKTPLISNENYIKEFEQYCVSSPKTISKSLMQIKNTMLPVFADYIKDETNNTIDSDVLDWLTMVKDYRCINFQKTFENFIDLNTVENEIIDSNISDTTSNNDGLSL